MWIGSDVEGGMKDDFWVYTGETGGRVAMVIRHPVLQCHFFLSTWVLVFLLAGTHIESCSRFQEPYRWAPDLKCQGQFEVSVHLHQDNSGFELQVWQGHLLIIILKNS